MHWHNVLEKNNSWLMPLAAFAALSFGIIISPKAAAVDTGVGVTICGADVPPAQITISQPVNDSVVEQSVTTFRGTVQNASQIETSIDGQYSSTISIGPETSSFEFDLALPAGTHTVRAVANALCGGQNADDTVVVTYTPAAEAPSTGATTPTTVEGETILGGQPATGESIPDNNVPQIIAQIPIVGAAVNTVTDFMRAIGLESTITSSGDRLSLIGIARVAITVAALTSIVLASTLAPIALTAVPGVSELFTATSHRSMLYLEWAIRGIGVLALALAYFI